MILPGHQMNDSVNTELDVMRGRSALIWAMLPWSLPHLIVHLVNRWRFDVDRSTQGHGDC